MFSPKALIEYSSKNNIWRLLISPCENILIEERDIVSKQAFFTILELSSRKKILTSYQFGESGWIGVEHFNDRLIIFHKYIKPDMPFHKGIFVFDYYKKEMIWQSDELLFHHASGSFVFASSISEQEFYKIRIDTGEKIECFGNDFQKFSILINENSPNTQTQDYLFPEFVSETDSRISELFEKSAISTVNLEKPFEYINFNHFLILAFNIKKSQSLFDYQIIVYDFLKSKKYLNLKLAENIKAKYLDSFFIKGNTLFLLKNKDSLLVYKLPVAD